MRKRLTSISIAGGAALAACFGAGPAPQKTEATIVFVAPTPTGNICTDSRYISSLAIGPTSGYGLYLPFVPPNNSGCTMGTQGADIEVLSFDLDGGSPQGTPIGPAGNSITIAPPIATSTTGVYWSTGNMVYSGSASVNVNLGGGGPSSFTALSMAAGAASLFMIGFAQFPGGYFEEPWNPQWPCCNNGGPGNGSGSGVFITMPLPAGTGSSITPTVLGSASPYCDELKHCLVANPTDVYYMRHGDVAAGYTAAIDDYSKITDTITTLDTISTMLSQSATPVGLGTTPTHVAWAVAMNGQQFQQEIPPGCWIFVHTVGEPGGGHQVFQSGNFSCLDLAMDDSFIYFTIVRSVHQDDNNCGNCSEPIHGVGIGRVSFDGSTYESIALNIQGQSYAGPRRVLLDGLTGSALYLADPLVVAKVPRDALAGHQDIPQ